MSQPRQHPVGELLATAEETARIMWRSYDDHLRHRKDDPAWEEQAWVIYQRCMACSERVWRLKALKERGLGETTDDRRQTTDDRRVEAE